MRTWLSQKCFHYHCSNIYTKNKRCSQLRCPENFKSERWFFKKSRMFLVEVAFIEKNNNSSRKENLNIAEIYKRNNLFLKNAVSWEQRYSLKYVWCFSLHLSFSWLSNTAVEYDYRNNLKTSELLEFYILL